MRRFLALATLFVLTTSLFAAPPVMTGISPALDAKLARERLDLEHRLYERVDFPIQARRLVSEITLTEAKLKSLEKLLAEYQGFQRFSTGNPLTLTVEDTKLQILAAKLHLDDLKEEKSLLERYRDDQRRLYELRK